MAFAHRDVVDRERGRRVVVGDRASPLSVGDRCVYWVREVDVVGLVCLIERVAVDGDAHGLRRLPRIEGERGACREVVGRRRRRPVCGRIVDRHRVPARRGQRDREARGGRAGVAFAHRNVVDRELRQRNVAKTDRLLLAPAKATTSGAADASGAARASANTRRTRRWSRGNRTLRKGLTGRSEFHPNRPYMIAPKRGFTKLAQAEIPAPHWAECAARPTHRTHASPAGPIPLAGARALLEVQADANSPTVRSRAQCFRLRPRYLSVPRSAGRVVRARHRLTAGTPTRTQRERLGRAAHASARNIVSPPPGMSAGRPDVTTVLGGWG